MDLSSVLPLFLNKRGGADDKTEALLRMAQGEKPDLGTVMQMAMQQKKSPQGLVPVVDIASNGIVGKLYKYFHLQKR